MAKQVQLQSHHSQCWLLSMHVGSDPRALADTFSERWYVVFPKKLAKTQHVTQYLALRKIFCFQSKRVSQ